MTVNRFSTPEPESRRLCPICPGLPMEKITIGAGPGRLLLDGCRRCGGVWFDAGEVDRLRGLGMKAIEAQVNLNAEAHRKRCGRCQASYSRNDDRCPACKAPNVIRCPTCTGMLEVVRPGRAKLDACRRCRGVWFDGVELKEIWNAALVRRRGQGGVTGVDVAASSLDAFLFTAWMMPDATLAVGGAAEVVGGAAGAGAEAGAGVLEATGEMASSVFDSIANLISEIFG